MSPCNVYTILTASVVRLGPSNKLGDSTHRWSHQCTSNIAHGRGGPGDGARLSSRAQGELLSLFYPLETIRLRFSLDSKLPGPE
jgi:hypothetical protein